MRKRVLPALLALVAVAVTALAVAGRGKARDLPADRTVTLSMKGYAFNETNPTLAFRPGERIRFVVSNDEATTVRHNFRIVGMDVPCEREFLPGESREVTVTIPRSGEFAYTCCTHPGMGGKLVVAGR
jgi:plastocyanin